MDWDDPLRGLPRLSVKILQFGIWTQTVPDPFDGSGPFSVPEGSVQAPTGQGDGFLGSTSPPHGVCSGQLVDS